VVPVKHRTRPAGHQILLYIVLNKQLEQLPQGSYEYIIISSDKLIILFYGYVL